MNHAGMLHGGLAVLLMLLLAACAGTPSGEEPAEEPAEAGTEAEEEAIDIGGLLGDVEIFFGSNTTGDASPEGDGASPFQTPEQSSSVDGNTDADASEPPQATAGMRQEIQRLRAEAAGRAVPALAPQSSGPELTGPAIGVLFEGPRTPATEAVLGSLRRTVGEHPFSLVEPGLLSAVISRSGCTPATVADCARRLTRIPGVRLVARISGLQPSSGGDSVTARISLLDLELGGAPTHLQIQLPVRDGAVPATALDALADALFIHAAARTRTAPRIYHVVESVSEDLWLLSQGSDAGLTPGDRLSIHPSARVVHSPEGLTVAWLPAPTSGELEVVEAGAGSALARLVRGEAPSGDGYLVPSVR